MSRSSSAAERAARIGADSGNSSVENASDHERFRGVNFGGIVTHRLSWPPDDRRVKHSARCCTAVAPPRTCCRRGLLSIARQAENARKLGDLYATDRSAMTVVRRPESAFRRGSMSNPADPARHALWPVWAVPPDNIRRYDR